MMRQIIGYGLKQVDGSQAMKWDLLKNNRSPTDGCIVPVKLLLPMLSTTKGKTYVHNKGRRVSCPN